MMRSRINRQIFDQQIRAFRAWMKAREQNKPLIVSEYGVLYSHVAELNVAATVRDFMLWKFRLLLNTKDCSLGYAADECRLVQRWAWYGLDDPGNEFNRYGSLFNFSTLKSRPPVSATGIILSPGWNHFVTAPVVRRRGMNARLSPPEHAPLKQEEASFWLRYRNNRPSVTDTAARW